MDIKDLFKVHTSSRRLNESIKKVFGRKINFETFTLEQLEDARNKLRTQVYQARVEKGFNENLENDAYHQAQWMLDAINAEIAERDEHIIEADVEEGFASEVDMALHRIAKSEDEEELIDAMEGGKGAELQIALEDMMSDLKDELAARGMNDVMRDQDKMIEMLMDKVVDEFGEGDFDDDDGQPSSYDEYQDLHGGDDWDHGQYEESIKNEVSPPGFKGTVKAMKKHKDIDNPYALAWHMKNKGYKSHKKADGSDKKESVEQGEDMTTLREGEVQQASAIVTAKTMVDRVGRWIEELSGMENETLLQLGDSIRDEMGQEQAKAFIEQVAPAIQSALETLKGTRDQLSTSVRSLASGEQPADMLGAEPEVGGDMEAPAEPGTMDMSAEEPAGDEFAAAEPAAGGEEEAGREQRESINYQSRLLKVLAG